MIEVYKQVSRGIFNKHKKLFAFCLVVAVQKEDNKISQKEWDFFIKGAYSLNKGKMSVDNTSNAQNKGSIMF